MIANYTTVVIATITAMTSFFEKFSDKSLRPSLTRRAPAIGQHALGFLNHFNADMYGVTPPRLKFKCSILLVIHSGY